MTKVGIAGGIPSPRPSSEQHNSQLSPTLGLRERFAEWYKRLHIIGEIISFTPEKENPFTGEMVSLNPEVENPYRGYSGRGPVPR